MQLLYKNVFTSKNTHYNILINIIYWVFALGKDVFKWIYALSLFSKNKSCFGLLFITPSITFCLISIGNISKFRTNFRGNFILLIIMIIMLLIESFFEMPINLICPLNKIYLHTNYYKIFDTKKYLSYYLYIEILESGILFTFIMWYFYLGVFHYSAFILVALDFFLLVYFFGAKIFYSCFEVVIVPKDTIKKNQTKDTRTKNDYIQVEG